MYMYLKLGAVVKRVSRISLTDCIKPTVGTATEERLDPALWYKVLVIDSIFVDCECRRIYCNSEKTKESEHIHQSEVESLQVQDVCAFFETKDQIFINSDCYDYDPTMDELFDTTSRIFHHLSLEVFNKEGNTKTYTELMKVLHVFILPEIKFQKRDTENLKSVLKEIEQEHEKIEDLIEKKNKTKRNTEHTLLKQRERLLKTENFFSAKYISTLDEKFLCVFLQHLEKDCRQYNEALVSNNEAIIHLRDSLVEEDVSKLLAFRSMREELLDSLDRTGKAREEIKNVITRVHMKKKYKRSKQGMRDFHELYVYVACDLDKLNQEVKELINSKIKLSCIRESVLLTLKEIDSDGKSYGYNRKNGPFEIEFDLFDPSKKPEEWLTLQEKVTTHLQVKQAGFRIQYKKFCERIKLKCQKLVDESKLFSISSLSANHPPLLPSDSISIDEITGIGNSGFSSRWSFGSIPRHECKTLCNEVTQHISKTSYELAAAIFPEMHGITHSIHSKVYICYEEHVSMELMPILSALYERCYRDQCVALSKWISNMCLDDLGLGEDKMLKIMKYEKRPQETFTVVLQTEAVKNVIPKSRETFGCLIDLPVKELYLKCNEDCEVMPQSFSGAIDFNCLYDISTGGPLDTSSSVQIRKHSVDIESEKTDIDTAKRFTKYLIDALDTKADLHSTIVPKADINLRVLCEHPSCSNVPYPCIHQSQYVSPVVIEFYQAFDKFYQLVQEEDRAMTVISKLRQITQAMKFVECQIRKFSQKGEKSLVCADDILDVFILMLCNMESQMLLKLYAHINLMIHLSPTFMAGDAHDYALVNFSAAYQHLFEQQVLHCSSLKESGLRCP